MTKETNFKPMAKMMAKAVRITNFGLNFVGAVIFFEDVSNPSPIMKLIVSKLDLFRSDTPLE